MTGPYSSQKRPSTPGPPLIRSVARSSNQMVTEPDTGSSSKTQCADCCPAVSCNHHQPLVSSPSVSNRLAVDVLNGARPIVLNTRPMTSSATVRPRRAPATYPVTELRGHRFLLSCSDRIGAIARPGEGVLGRGVARWTSHSRRHRMNVLQGSAGGKCSVFTRRRHPTLLASSPVPGLKPSPPPAASGTPVPSRRSSRGRDLLAGAARGVLQHDRAEGRAGPGEPVARQPPDPAGS